MKPKYFVQHVDIGYSPYQNIISDLNFQINEGDFLSIIGPNGSGKSTIIKALCRINNVNNGLILFNGKKSILTIYLNTHTKCYSWTI